MLKNLIQEVHNFLLDKDYYSVRDESTISKLNADLLKVWGPGIESSIKESLTESLPDVDIIPTNTELDLKSKFDHSASVSRTTLRLTNENEGIEIIVTLLFNIDRALISLSSIHIADKKQYKGKSRLLTKIWNETWDEEGRPGTFLFKDYFKTIELLKATAGNKVYKT